MFNTYVNRFGLVINRSLEVFRLVTVHKLRLNAQPRQHDLELVVRASVQIRCRNDVVASLCKGSDRDELSSLTGRCRQSSYTTFQRSNSLLKDIDCGVHDAAVDVAELFEAKEPRPVSGVIESEGL